MEAGRGGWCARGSRAPTRSTSSRRTSLTSERSRRIGRGRPSEPQTTCVGMVAYLEVGDKHKIDHRML